MIDKFIPSKVMSQLIHDAEKPHHSLDHRKEVCVVVEILIVGYKPHIHE